MAEAVIVHDRPLEATELGFRADLGRSSTDVARLTSLREDELSAANTASVNYSAPQAWYSGAVSKERLASLECALKELHPRHIPTGGVKGMTLAAQQLVSENLYDDNFYIVDLGNVIRLWKAWRRAMPRVLPFYAVKCCPQPGVLKVLAALGAGFDCASRAEMDKVLALGVPPGRIIFAHPCKRPTDLHYAAQTGVKLTTFDTHAELDKMESALPNANLVIRIRADDPTAQVQLGVKYGCDVATEAKALLEDAHARGLTVVGVSFHVGSGCKNLQTYEHAISLARQVFDMAEEIGFTFDLLDIGGGFTGRFDDQGHVKLTELSKIINSALATYFPHDSNVKIISEPGRYFAEASMTLVSMIIGKRERPLVDNPAVKGTEYWITDGIYGSMNCMLYDFSDIKAVPLRHPYHLEQQAKQLAACADAGTFEPVLKHVSRVWGPTCDGMDFIFKNVELPDLEIGDWLLFPNFGAYTLAGACPFNGIEADDPWFCYVLSRSAADVEDSSDDEDEAEIEAVRAANTDTSSRMALDAEPVASTVLAEYAVCGSRLQLDVLAADH